MAEKLRPPIDLKNAVISRQNGVDVITDCLGNRFALVSMSKIEPLVDGPRIMGKTILEKIPGRNANIYKVQDENGRITAIKEVSLVHCASDEKSKKDNWKPLSLPEREYRAWQQLAKAGKSDHPGLLKYSKPPATMEDGSVLLEREWAEGASLAKLLEEGALTKLQVFEIMTRALDALSCLHSAGVVHRDVKPANIIVLIKDNQVASAKLIDLGVSSLKGVRDTWETSATMTTCFYSPGFSLMYSLSNPSERTDLFSVGATLLYALTGKNADDIHDSGSNIYRIPDEITGPLRKILENCLQAATDKIYPSCEEMKKALKKIIKLEIAQSKDLRLEKEKKSLAKWKEIYDKKAWNLSVTKKEASVTEKIFELAEELSIPGYILAAALIISYYLTRVFLASIYNVIRNPPFALYLLHKKSKVKRLEKAVEEERAQLKAIQESLLLTEGDKEEKKT